ncbi:MAG: hypothetical protein NTV25_02690 [Methanothrix sp.]|nr:hypothetical protein [Methanothrix sp.]
MRTKLEPGEVLAIGSIAAKPHPCRPLTSGPASMRTGLPGLPVPPKCRLPGDTATQASCDPAHRGCTALRERELYLSFPSSHRKDFC